MSCPEKSPNQTSHQKLTEINDIMLDFSIKALSLGGKNFDDISKNPILELKRLAPPSANLSSILEFNIYEEGAEKNREKCKKAGDFLVNGALKTIVSTLEKASHTPYLALNEKENRIFNILSSIPASDRVDASSFTQMLHKHFRAVTKKEVIFKPITKANSLDHVMKILIARSKGKDFLTISEESSLEFKTVETICRKYAIDEKGNVIDK